MNTVNKSNGELPAFACVSETYQQDGLTKREYFAAMAMQGLITKLRAIDSQDRCEIAELSIKMADTILLALQKK